MKRVTPSIIEKDQEPPKEKRINASPSVEEYHTINTKPTTLATQTFNVAIDGFHSTIDVASNHNYVVYHIKIRQAMDSWTVYKRYSEFDTLFEHLKGEFINLASDLPHLPPKKLFGNFSNSFLEERRRHLQKWLREVVSNPTLCRSSFLKTFLAQEKLQRIDSDTSLVARLQNVGLKENDENSGPLNVRKPSSQSSGDENEHERMIHSKGSKTVCLDDFEKLIVLGQGSFGKVILCRHKITGELFADKVIKKKKVAEGKQFEHTKTERAVLEVVDHPFIVKLHYAFQTKFKLHFLLDYVPGGELFFHLGKFGRFSERLSKFYTAEISLALGYLHEKNIIYRDLKPENILLDSDGHIKLADFGLSKAQDEATNSKKCFSFCGTPEYLAPEVINKTGHNKSVDWWSLGALLYEMLTGLPPWYCENRKELFRHIRTSNLTFPRHLSKNATSLLKALLAKESADRLGSVADVEDVKSHPFFEDIDFEKLLRKEITAPFKPSLSKDTKKNKEEIPDTNNFDACFTKMSIGSRNESPMTEQDLKALRPSLFAGFTFVNDGKKKGYPEYDESKQNSLSSNDAIHRINSTQDFNSNRLETEISGYQSS